MVIGKGKGGLVYASSGHRNSECLNGCHGSLTEMIWGMWTLLKDDQPHIGHDITHPYNKVRQTGGSGRR